MVTKFKICSFIYMYMRLFAMDSYTEEGEINFVNYMQKFLTKF